MIRNFTLAIKTWNYAISLHQCIFGYVRVMIMKQIDLGRLKLCLRYRWERCVSDISLYWNYSIIFIIVFSEAIYIYIIHIIPRINHLPPVCWSTFGILVWNDSAYVNVTQWWYFFIIFEYILHIPTPHIMIFCFPLPYFPLSTSALFFA